MATKKFTEEEMKHLQASAYVLDVSPSIVHFSAEFKKKFWESFLEGSKPRDIVIQLDINPDILGEHIVLDKGYTLLEENSFCKSHCMKTKSTISKITIGI